MLAWNDDLQSFEIPDEAAYEQSHEVCVNVDHDEKTET